jgi:hypothetical protein
VVGLLYLVVDLVILFWAVLQGKLAMLSPRSRRPSKFSNEKNKKFISGFCHFFCRIRLRFLRDQILNFFRFNFKFLPIAFLHWIGCHRHPCKINSRHSTKISSLDTYKVIRVLYRVMHLILRRVIISVCESTVDVTRHSLIR